MIVSDDHMSAVIKPCCQSKIEVDKYVLDGSGMEGCLNEFHGNYLLSVGQEFNVTAP